MSTRVHPKQMINISYLFVSGGSVLVAGTFPSALVELFFFDTPATVMAAITKITAKIMNLFKELINYIPCLKYTGYIYFDESSLRIYKEQPAI